MNKAADFPSKEYELIRRIQSRLPNAARIPPQSPYELLIGDDAAIRLNKTTGERLIITADISVENVHFSLEWMTFEEIGYRAMVSNLSDCAAMGATPDSAIVQLVFPSNHADGVSQSIEQIYTGFAKACKKWNFPIAGGDLSRGPVWTIGITLIGSIPPGSRPLTRAGIRDGDALWVTGIPGMSAAGLAAIQYWKRENVPKQYRQLVDAHISPIPKISEGLTLASNQSVHAMMDLSDGLSKDISTLCHDNGLGFVFDAVTNDATQSAPPLSAMISLADNLNRDWQDWFYHGGEEYELIFACDPLFDPHKHNIIRTNDGSNNNNVLVRLGYFTSKSSDVLLPNGRLMPLCGWDHL